jgi:hypothetical protein
VREVLRTFASAYLKSHPVGAQASKVLARVGRCRDGAFGFSTWDCADCQRAHTVPNGCGDRHCAGCQHARREKWLVRQRADLLPVAYYHWIFTLPAPLRPLALQNPAPIYGLLFDAASATLLRFGRERFDGAELGLTLLLHTCGQNLMAHPHIHALVTGGGLTQDAAGQPLWRGPKQARWLFPVHAVRDAFRGKFLAGLRRLFAEAKLQLDGALAPLREPSAVGPFFQQLRAKRWVLFAKGYVSGADAVLDYLGRYTHRVAISDARLIQLDAAAGTVSFRYKDYADDARLKTLTLRGEDFVRRWLLHVLPAGFTKVRHYGLLGNNRRKKMIPLARQALAHSPHRRELAPTKRPPTAPSPPPPPTCPHCGSVRVRCVYRLDATGRVVWRRWPLPVVRAPPRPLDSL